MPIQQVELPGHTIRLEPLSMHHRDGLFEAAADGELWKLRFTVIPGSPEGMSLYINEALECQARGQELPFAILEKSTGKVVGATRFRHIEPLHRKLEIGPTFIGQSHQRTAANTETKYLMLRHAFERMECVRVQMIADVLNERSRTAILRIGAKQEGNLRHHLIMPDGRFRDSVIFSIINTEWPQVKKSLLDKLGSHQTA